MSHHFVGPPFWIGCSVTPLLIAFAAWPLDDDMTVFVWLIMSAVFAGVVGLFTQVIADLLRAHRQSRLSWIEFLFLGIIVLFAAAYGCALYFLPDAEHLLRYGVVAAFPFLIAGLYARIRLYVFTRRHGPPNV